MTATVRRRGLLLGVFCAWTIFVWGLVRVRNIVGDVALSGSQRFWALVLSTSFWLPAVVLVGALVVARPRGSSAGPAVRYAVLGLASWTVLVWCYKVVDIAVFSDHEPAFVAVHVLLAIISTTLAVATARSFYASRELRVGVPGRPG